MRRLLLALLFLGAAPSVAPSVARATPPDLFGMGARTAALGMTGTSYADDYEATFANPAGLARARRRGLHIGLSAAAFDLQLDGERFPMDSARGMTIGATLPLPFGDVLEDRLVFGLAVYTPQQVLLRGEVFYAGEPQWPVLSRGQSVSIDVGLGFDFHSTDLAGLRLGVGVIALANLVGNLDVRLDETNRFTSVVETQLLASFAPTAGASYDVGDFSFGLVYRHELRSDMNLQIRVSDLPVMIPLLTVGGIVQYDPAQLVGEVSWRPDPNLRIVANLTGRFWSFYPGAQRPSSLVSPYAPAPSFSDVVSPRLGVEGTIRDRRAAIVLRGGYALEPTPSPPARMAPLRLPDGRPVMDGMNPRLVPARFLDSDRHILTAGIGFSYDITDTERLRLDLFAQTHFLIDRTHNLPADELPTDMNMDRWMRTGGIVVVGGWAFSLEF
jgi:long-chain fatty acid transport protein